MPPCPPDEKLTGLLADALSAAERDALARHVEGCAPCQEKLARRSLPQHPRRLATCARRADPRSNLASAAPPWNNWR
jgi:hypothetical protein